MSIGKYKTARELMLQVEKLPALPQVVHGVLQVIQNGDPSAQDIADIMQHDPVITGKVFQLANSSMYAGNAKFSTLTQAISRLGTKEILNLVLATGVLNVFKQGSGKLNYYEFWKHSLCTASAAKVIASMAEKLPVQFRRGDNPFYLAGLLHDIGILLVEQFEPKVFERIIELCGDGQSSYTQTERGLLGYSHEEVGALLMEHWKFPYELMCTVRYHHNPDQAKEEYRVYVQVLHLADWLCNHEGYGMSLDGIMSGFSESAWFDLGLDVTQIPVIMESVRQEADQAKEFLALLQ